jgi:hypothetical protein
MIPDTIKEVTTTKSVLEKDSIEFPTNQEIMATKTHSSADGKGENFPSTSSNITA